MNEIVTKVYGSPVGELILGAVEGRLCLCDWVGRKNREEVDRRLRESVGAVFADGSSDVIELAVRELDEYFAGERRGFDIPLLIIGTPFQKKVREALMKIPYGGTASYGEIAHRIGHPQAVRAVANAIGANPLSIFLPCHRVVGADGSMTGYAGGLEAKRRLLDLEKESSEVRET